MTVQQSQGWTPNALAFMPGLAFLNPERINRFVTNVVEGGLVVAGIVNAGFAIGDIRTNQLLPALAHTGTSVFCFSAYCAIEGLKAKVELLKTLETQMASLQQNNNELKDRIADLNNLSNAFRENSTNLQGITTQINDCLTKLDAFSKGQDVSFQDLIGTVKGLFKSNEDKEKILTDLMKGLLVVQDNLVQSSQNNQRQLELLTAEFAKVSKERSRLDFLTGIVPRVLAISNNEQASQLLSDEDKRQLTAIGTAYRAYLNLA